MTLRALSASQAERFDPEQVGGCKRRWFFQDVMRLEVPEPEESKNDGHAGHALFAMHYRGEPLPKRHRMLKAVRGALAKGEIRAPAPGQLIESRFDGQPARDENGERLPLRPSSTLWIGGVPWDGYVDLRFYRAGMITVLDHKFSSDIHAYAKSADQLLATVQMPVYALDSLRLWPEAQHVELVHHYVSKKGVDSFLRRQLVTVEQIRQRGREIERLVREMIAVSQAKSPDEVPGNRASCHTWNGCPFQSRCTAFKEKPKMDLNPEEQEWLSALGGGEAEKPASVTSTGEFMKAPTTGPDADAATELEIASAAGALVPGDGQRRPASLILTALPPDDNDPFAVFAPKDSVPTEQPARQPSCRDCDAELNGENGSQRDGVWTHVGCPAKPGALRGVGITAGPNNPFDEAGVAPAASGPKCPSCPHPDHAGAQCTGKRGKGRCRCEGKATPVVSVDGVVNPDGSGAIAVSGERTNAPKFSEQLGHLPTCVQNDGGKWLCMEGCTAGEVQALADRLKSDGNPLLAAVGARLEGTAPPAIAEAAASYQNAQASPDALQRERDMQRLTLGELEASERERDGMKKEFARLRELEQRVGGAGLPSATGWTGTLQVKVNLGPETLALLTRLFGR